MAATSSRARRTPVAAVLLAALATVLVPAAPAAADDPTEVWFPVQMPADYPDTWGDSRSGGRSHEGTDIMASQMRPVFAADDAVIAKAENEHVREGQYASSYYLLLHHDDGHASFYVHLNNDTPGRPRGCDGRGGAENAFSPRLTRILRERGTLQGVRVRRGEHIAYVGSSGNAGCGNDHLHFELWHGHDWGSPKFNPWRSLSYAHRDGRWWGPGEGTGGAESQASTGPAQPDPEPTGRLSGANRIGTAVRLSEHGFTRATTVVVAPAEVHEEALLAAPLAAVHDAPVLLVRGAGAEGENLPPAVVDEIDRLGATRAIVVGDPGRISADVERELVVRAGLEPAGVRRVSGTDVLETSARIAEEVDAATDGTRSPLLVLHDADEPRRSWPDALTASTLAARQEVPILLAEGDGLPEETTATLREGDFDVVRIIGGPAAVPAPVEEEVRDVGLATRRLSGDDRYGTSVAVADELVAAGDAAPTETYLTTGLDFPDALAAGPVVAARSRVLVLVHGLDAARAPATTGWFRHHAEAVEAVVAVGGTGVITDAVLTDAARNANWPS